MQFARIEEIIKSTIIFKLFSSAYYTFKSAMETLGHIAFNLRDIFFLFIKGKVSLKKITAEASRIGVDFVACRHDYFSATRNGNG